MTKLNAEKIRELNAERAELHARRAGLSLERDNLKNMIHSPFSPFLPRLNAVRAELEKIRARDEEIRAELGEPARRPYKVYSDIYR